MCCYSPSLVWRCSLRFSCHKNILCAQFEVMNKHQETCEGKGKKCYYHDLVYKMKYRGGECIVVVVGVWVARFVSDEIDVQKY